MYIQVFLYGEKVLVYVRSYLPLRQLTKHKTSSDIQALVFEINLRKEKWLFLSTYKPPPHNCQYFLDSAFMEHYNYYDLIKNNTCFKSYGSCLDLILTNRKY